MIAGCDRERSATCSSESSFGRRTFKGFDLRMGKNVEIV